jgi:hypothetical protein
MMLGRGKTSNSGRQKDHVFFWGRFALLWRTVCLGLVAVRSCLLLLNPSLMAAAHAVLPFLVLSSATWLAGVCFMGLP